MLLAVRIKRIIAQCFFALMLISAPSTQADMPPDGRFVFVTDKVGTVFIYDVNQDHKRIGRVDTVENVTEVRGVCASPVSNLLYVAYMASDGGHAFALNMKTLKVVWNVAYDQQVDRIACTPDGKKLFIPCNEFSSKACMTVVDGATGAQTNLMAVPAKSHDALASLSGNRIYLETKSTNTITVIDSATETIISTIGPFAGIGGPFTINGQQTRVYGNFFGLNGFQIGDITTGKPLTKVTIPGQTPGEGGGGTDGYLQNHGIGLTPDEREIWVADGPATGGSFVHIFDVTVDPPVATGKVDVESPCPHWLTFSNAGDYAYIAGPHKSQRENPQGKCPQVEGFPTKIINTKTRSIVGEMAASDGYVIEAIFKNGAITEVGNQYGVGRR